MAWKPKEKELTKQEAIALARSELCPYWYGSRPLIAAVKSGNHATCFPLEEEFWTKNWLLIFADITTRAGISAMQYGREIYRRYNGNAVNTILVVDPSYRFLLNANIIEQFAKRHRVDFPIVLDYNKLLQEAFNVTSWPAIVILAEQKVIASRVGKNWNENIEQELQQFLRKSDPGLPLLPLFDDSSAYPNDVEKIDFGRNGNAPYPSPGFISFSKELGTANFDSSFITGKWVQDSDKIITSDPSATITINSPSSSVSIVARTVTKTSESSKIVLEVDGASAFDVFRAEDLIFDEDGQSAVRVDSPRIYDLLVGLPENKRNIIFHFPTAERVPVGICGLRFY